MADRDQAHPGVWVGREKIAAIGVRFKRGATLHGLALNVSNELDLFGKIVPCGIRGRGVTSLTRVLGREVAPADAGAELRHALSRLLAVDMGPAPG